MIRSKELEVLLSRARAAEAKELLQAERSRADKLDEEVRLFFLNLILFLTSAPLIPLLRSFDLRPNPIMGLTST